MEVLVAFSIVAYGTTRRMSFCGRTLRRICRMFECATTEILPKKVAIISLSTSGKIPDDHTTFVRLLVVSACCIEVPQGSSSILAVLSIEQQANLRSKLRMCRDRWRR